MDMVTWKGKLMGEYTCTRVVTLSHLWPRRVKSQKGAPRLVHLPSGVPSESCRRGPAQLGPQRQVRTCLLRLWHHVHPPPPQSARA